MSFLKLCLKTEYPRLRRQENIPYEITEYLKLFDTEHHTSEINVAPHVNGHLLD